MKFYIGDRGTLGVCNILFSSNVFLFWFCALTNFSRTNRWFAQCWTILEAAQVSPEKPLASTMDNKGSSDSLSGILFHISTLFSCYLSIAFKPWSCRLLFSCWLVCNCDCTTYSNSWIFWLMSTHFEWVTLLLRKLYLGTKLINQWIKKFVLVCKTQIRENLQDRWEELGNYAFNFNIME